MSSYSSNSDTRLASQFGDTDAQHSAGSCALGDDACVCWTLHESCDHWIKRDIAPKPQNGTVEAIISSLCAQVEAAEERGERWRVEVLQRRKEAAAHEEAVVALTEALRPFAAIGAEIHESWDGDRRAYTLNLARLKIRHLRRAVALVAARTPDAGRSAARQLRETDK